MITYVPIPRGPLSAAAGMDMSSKMIRRLVKVQLNLQLDLSILVFNASFIPLDKIFRFI